MHYVRNTLGIALLLGLWGVAVTFIAPAMERRLQADAQRLLNTLEEDVSAEVDGLIVKISGSVETAEDRYAVFAALKPLHPLADIRPNVSILEKPRFERKLRPGAINLNSPSSAAPAASDPAAAPEDLPPLLDMELDGRPLKVEVGLDNCSSLQVLDPSMPCRPSNE